MGGRTVIVGAGAGGLAVAAELRRRGQDLELLEQSRTVGASWRTRYDSLRLHTARGLSGLPGLEIPRRCGPWVGRDDLVAYLEQYADHHGLRPRFGVGVTGLDRAAGRWVVHTTEGVEEADAVVLATGLTRRPVLPRWPGLDRFTGTLRHSSEYRRPRPYAGRRVLVVGGGNSAAEIATELSEHAAQVWLSVRRPPGIVRRDVHGLPSQLFGILLRPLPAPVVDGLTTLMRRFSVPDLAALGLPGTRSGFSEYVRSQTVPILDHGFVAAVESGRIQVVPGVVGVEDPDVRLSDGRVLEPDVIIAATGYRHDLERLIGHLGVLDPDGRPTIAGGQTAASAPGLFLVGLNPVLSGLLREVGREARAVARTIAGEDRGLTTVGSTAGRHAG